MQNAPTLIVFLLNFIELNVTMLNVAMLIVILLNFIQLNAFLLSVEMLSFNILFMIVKSFVKIIPWVLKLYFSKNFVIA